MGAPAAENLRSSLRDSSLRAGRPRRSMGPVFFEILLLPVTSHRQKIRLKEVFPGSRP